MTIFLVLTYISLCIYYILNGIFFISVDCIKININFSYHTPYIDLINVTVIPNIVSFNTLPQI